MGTTNRTPEFLAKFPLGKVPALETADGFCLVEGHAIARFVAESGPKGGQLLGQDAKSRAKIAQWSCFADGELAANCTAALIMCLMKVVPYNEATYNKEISSLERALKRLDAALQDGRKFLVGDAITLADVMVVGALALAARCVLDPEMQKCAPAVMKYWHSMMEVPELKKAFGGVVPVAARLKP